MKVAPDSSIQIPSEAVTEAQIAPAPSTPEQQVQEKQNAVFLACTEAAMAEAKLLQVRHDRDVAPEVISDAAGKFRQARGNVDAALTDLLALQVKLFTEVAQAAVT